MSFPHYESYRDSGVEWLGKMPNHWEVCRTKFLFSIRKRQTRDEDEIVTAFRDGEVTLRINRRTEGFTNSLQEIGYQGIRKGDLIIHAMDAFAGAIGVSDSDGKSTPVYSVCEPRTSFVNAWYYGRLLRHIALSGYINSLAKGVRERSTEFRWSEAGNLFLPFPPIEEQKTITNFLDNETAKIDALIAEQQRLIELLKEKRQAVISFAVTKGLNPDAPMKDSGIGWLGEVPEHWKVTPIKSLAKLFGRIGYRGYTTADIVEEGAGAITLSPSNMSDGNISLHKSTYISWEKYHESPEIKVSYGDIVMVKTGSTLGKVSLVRQQDIPAITINPQLVIFKNIVCNPLFLFYSMLAARIQSEIEVNNTGSSIPTLTQECIGNLVIPLPSLDEQQTIATFLDGEIEKLNTLTAEAKRGIELLQERRTALISAAVTGKIDVRGLVSTALPEEAAA